MNIFIDLNQISFKFALIIKKITTSMYFFVFLIKLVDGNINYSNIKKPIV